MMKEYFASIVYQIWPRSFYDSNYDGIGDIQGIIAKLNYIKSLNVDFIWLSPIYASPNHDFGYDISDYYQVNPEYGTISDFNQLIVEAKKRDIKIIMDLVANHTSSLHPWFQEAISDPTSTKRDYYVFKRGKNGNPPNNWISIFGNSAWTKIAEDEYVLTLFTPWQCDLNWENEEVRDQIVNIMKYWIELGVAGFRLDVINTISKDTSFPDKNPHKKGLQFADDLIINRPKSFEYVAEMMIKLKDYPIFTVGEGMLMTQEAARQYSKIGGDNLDMMFHFDLHMIGCGPLGKYDFRKLYRWNILGFKKVIRSWQSDMQKNQYWLGNYMSNHDQPRQVSRFGNDQQFHKESAKCLALINFTLRGTPFIYQGEEIGMTNCHLEMDEWQDFEAKNTFKALQSMMKVPPFLAKRIIQKMTRDHARTPMQWKSDDKGGFTEGTPWMKVNPNASYISVSEQENDASSILNFYRRLTKVYKENQVLTFGEWIEFMPNHKRLICFQRHYYNEELFVICNLSKHVTKFEWPMDMKDYQIILSTSDDRKHILPQGRLNPYEGWLMKKTKN